MLLVVASALLVSSPSYANACAGEWTRWFSRDLPSGSGDYELLSDIRRAHSINGCKSPSQIEGRTVGSRVDWTQSRDTVTVSPSLGLTCVNADQSHGSLCKNYEVRFCCVGEWNAWAAWTDCITKCDGGITTRSRSCNMPDKCVGSSTETMNCNTQPCIGSWNNWNAWSECDVTCGGGQMLRTRSCTGPGSCIGDNAETKNCTTPVCNGGWTSWNDWSECDVTCGGGRMKRVRSCTGTGVCDGTDMLVKSCNVYSCKEWSQCSKTCGGGIKSRRHCRWLGFCRTIRRTCNPEECLGIWNNWTSWSACDVKCKGGQQSRSRSCQGPERCIGHSADKRACNTQKCREIHPCDKRPCRGRGLCKRNGPSYSCTCRSRYSGINCEHICMGEWTRWFSRDTPKGSGDFEGLSKIRKEYPLQACLSPYLFDGRVVGSHIHWKQSPDVVSETALSGLKCLHSKQPNGRRCKNYEVRFCCPRVPNKKAVEIVAKEFIKTIATAPSTTAVTDTTSSKPTETDTDTDTDNKDCPTESENPSDTVGMSGRACSSRRKKRQANAQPETDEPIKTKRDVLFIIDESGSVGSTYFKSFLLMAQAIISMFCGDVGIGREKTRVAVMSFDQVPHRHIDFDNFLGYEQLIGEIGKIPYNRSTSRYTCLGDSLQFALDEMFNVTKGSRMDDDRVEKIVYLLSDGCTYCPSNSNNTEQLDNVRKILKDEKIPILIYFVGSHSNECRQEMEKLMGGTHCRQFFTMDTWAEVEHCIQVMQNVDCFTSWSKHQACQD